MMKLPKTLLHDKQREIFSKLKRFNVIVCGRRFGKTRLAAFKLIISAWEKVGVYYWVSPTWGVGTPAWRLIVSVLKNARIVETTRTIYLPNGSIIEFKSADNPDSLRGEGLSGLVIDECAQIKEDAWTLSLRPALSENEGWVIFIGTPKGMNWFFLLYEKAKITENWAYFKFTSYDNPHIPAGEIDSAKLDLSPLEFQQEYLAEFISDSGTIFERDWWQGKNRYNFTEPYNPIAYYISFDTAETDNDNSAFTAWTVGYLTRDYKLRIVEVGRERVKFPQLLDLIKKIAGKYRSDLLQKVIIEEKSSGRGAIQSLRQTAEPWLANRIQEYTPKISKEARWNQSALWCRNGCVELPYPDDNVSWLFSTEEELFNLPGTPFVDRADSFSQLILFLEHILADGRQKRVQRGKQ